MFRNSTAKVSISAVSTRTCRAKRLYMTTAGMAAASPTAVAISASAMPGATAWMLDDVVVESPMNAVMMPHTVPKSPMNGAVLDVVARNVSAALEARHLLDAGALHRPLDVLDAAELGVVVAAPGVPRFALVRRCSSW